MRKLVVLVGLALHLTLAGTAGAQGLQTGIITGLVKDQTGMPLPGATVTVTSPVLQGMRTAVTDDIGAYIIRGLPPGTYRVRIELTGMTTATDMAEVPLGGTAEVNASLEVARLQEAVQVSAAVTPPPLAVTQTQSNYRQEMVSLLPMGRRPFEVAELAPGVTDNTPNVGQIAIAGAFAFDSLFLIDGVDTNDNLFGQSHGLYIEDAIQETQVVTSGASAEYGRFGGGVVNVITKSGGNRFAGSFRSNFYRPSWTSETPFQRERGQKNSDTLTKYYEGTIGGPIVRDRLWFFNGDRYENSAAPHSLAEVGTNYDTVTNNKRVELKLTATPIVNHRISGSYTNNPTTANGFASINSDMSMDLATIIDNRKTPNNLWVVNWNGAATNKLFVTAQWSRKIFKFENAGGTSTVITDSPFLSRGNFGIGATANRHFNAPYFDGNDPENRNNRQVAGSVSYYVTNPSFGRHDFKVGGEDFRSWRTGGNSQSATGYVFLTDYVVGADGRPALDSAGHPIPVWTPSATGTRTRIQQWIATPGATLNINTLSLYVQDRWQLRSRVTVDLGLRYEKVDSDATGDIVGADTKTWLPRLGVSYDIAGNGHTIAQATYGRYSGRFTERAFGRNTNVGTPSRLDLSYIGPEGVGRNFAPGFDLSNYVITGGNFPTATVFFDPDLTSPKTDEFTLSLGRELPRAGHVKATYTWRNTDAFIEDFIDDPSAAGKITVIRNGVNFGTFDRVLYKNTDAPTRRYEAVQIESRMQVLDRLPVWGHWTVQIKNDGNFEGEAASQPGNPSIWFDYPEMLSESRYYPNGHLDEFQRHKVRLWTTYNQPLGRFGSVDISPLWRINSGLTYSLMATSVGMTAIQMARNPGYARANTTTATMYFDERGSESFKGYGVLDLALRYGIPVWKTAQPWIQAQLFNVLDNQKLIQWNTTVTPDPNSPKDDLGQPTGYIKGPNFGKATANTQFPAWSSGQTGGRTFRLAIGVRF